jgi:hypothetical protein
MGPQQASVNANIHITDVHACNFCQDTGIHAPAHDGRNIQHLTRRWRETGRAGQHRILHGWRDRRTPCRDYFRNEKRVAVGSGKEICWIYASACGQRLHCFRRQEVYRHASYPWAGCQVTKNDTEGMCCGDLIITKGEQEEYTGALDASSKKAEEVYRRFVGPVDVFNHEHSGQCSVGECFKDCSKQLVTTFRCPKEKANLWAEMSGDVHDRTQGSW